MKKLILLASIAALIVGSLPLQAADRNTPEIAGQLVVLEAGEDLAGGALAGVSTNGLAYGAKNSIPLTAIGRVERSAESGETVTIKRGVFRWDQSGTNTATYVTSADLGKSVYVGATAVSVSLTASGTHTNILGKVFGVDSVGVWIRSGF